MDKDECVDKDDDAELARLRRENGELRALCEQQRRYIDACQARGGDPAAKSGPGRRAHATVELPGLARPRGAAR